MYKRQPFLQPQAQGKKHRVKQGIDEFEDVYKRQVLQALQIMRHNTVDSLLVTSGREHRLEGIVWLKNLQEVKDYSASLEEYITQDYISVYADTSLQEIIDTVDYDASGIIPVVNHENELLGGLTKSGLLATLSKRYRRDSTEGAEE